VQPLREAFKANHDGSRMVNAWLRPSNQLALVANHRLAGTATLTTTVASGRIGFSLATRWAKSLILHAHVGIVRSGGAQRSLVAHLLRERREFKARCSDHSFKTFSPIPHRQG
jgi:hypothetical protein